MGKYSKSNKMPKRVVVNGGAAGIKGPSPPKTAPPTPALPYRRATRTPMAKTCAWKNHAVKWVIPQKTAEAVRKTRAAGYGKEVGGDEESRKSHPKAESAGTSSAEYSDNSSGSEEEGGAWAKAKKDLYLATINFFAQGGTRADTIKVTHKARKVFKNYVPVQGYERTPYMPVLKYANVKRRGSEPPLRLTPRSEERNEERNHEMEPAASTNINVVIGQAPKPIRGSAGYKRPYLRNRN